MKTKLVLSVFAGLWLALLFMPLQAKAQGKWQVPDSCLKMELPDDLPNGFFNPDSVKIDSCENSSTFDKRYLKNGLYIGFDEYVFFQKPIPRNTEVDINAIDSINYYNTYQKFKELSNIIGGFKFKRESGEIDSGSLRRKIFEFKINNYYCYDSLKLFIDSIEHVDLFHFRNIPSIHPDFVIDKKKFTSKNNYIIYPNPVTDYLYIHNQNYNHNNIIISSVTGEVLLTIEGNNEEEQKINIQSLSPGIYFLRIGNVCKKFIVNR